MKFEVADMKFDLVRGKFEIVGTKFETAGMMLISILMMFELTGVECERPGEEQPA